MMITQREKDDALWHHYQTAKLSKNSNTRGDLRMHVLEVLQSVGDSPLLRCALPPGETIDNIRSLAANRDISDVLVEPGSVDVLLSQPGMRNPPAVEPSAVIRLWKPWIEINLDSASRPLPTSPVGQVGDKDQETLVIAGNGTDATRKLSLDIPRHLESPRSYSEISAPDHRARFVLLCSRFVVG
jgi:hypothetical protein